MTADLYTSALKKLLDGSFNLPSDTIKLTLIDTGAYTVDLANHDFIDDVPAGARIATLTLSNKTTTGGVFDNTVDPSFTSVTGVTSEALIFWKDTGVEATSPLIAYTDEYAGLPVSPNGNNITVTFDNGTAKIFRLVNA